MLVKTLEWEIEISSLDYKHQIWFIDILAREHWISPSKLNELLRVSNLELVIREPNNN